MTIFNPRLLTPPLREEEVDPYRPVWQSIVIEMGIYFIIAVGLTIVTQYLGISISERFYPMLAILLVAMPVVLWLIFSWWQERRALAPRQRLLAVAVVSALVANAIGVPLINDFLRVDEWLPLSDAINRIIGYSLTVGIVQEFLKYMVVRYMAWSDCFRTRLDAVAYGAASAVGYAFVLNLHLIFPDTPPPDIVANRVFSTLVVQVVTTIVVSYGLAELRFSTPTTMIVVFTLALAAFITGLSIPIRAGLVSSGLILGVGTTRPLFGLGFSAALLVVILLIFSFLYASSERRAREATSQED